MLVFVPASAWSEQQLNYTEQLSGYYSRVGNNGSPSSAAGNNIYIKFFDNRWVAMLFVPYPYAISLEPQQISNVFAEAKKQTSTSAYVKGKFAGLSESVTLNIERYGYRDDRILFECGSLAPCSIKLGDGYLELIKPGVINEHIVRYDHVDTP